MASAFPRFEPVGFLFLGDISNNVFINTPAHLRLQTIPQLKNRIDEVIAEITPEMIQNVRRGFQERLQHCIDMEGGHFKQITH